MTNNRNSYLDVAKFLFSIIIVLYHFKTIFLGGYIVVEAFFMISGYFMMKSIKKSDENEPWGISTVKFVTHKYSLIAYYLIPAAIIGCIAYIYILPRETSDVIMQATLILFEMVPLQTVGYNGFFTTGVAWYLSALLLASAIVYPLAKKFKVNFTFFICPLVSIFIYGYLIHNFNAIKNANSWIENLFHSGLLRGIAGLCAGCFLHECSERLKAVKITVTGKIIFTVFEILGWAYCILIMCKYPKLMYDAVVVFLMFGLLLIGINRYSYLSYLIQFKWTKHLATVSTIIYLNHYYWAQFIWKQFPEYSDKKQFILYICLIAGSSAIVYGAGKLAMFIVKKIKPKIIAN